ncbi:MAG: AraC family transcriptional regulator [Niabella sp.]
MNIYAQLQPATEACFAEKDLFSCNVKVADDHNISSNIEQDTFIIPAADIEQENCIKQLKTDGLILLDTRMQVTEELLWKFSLDCDCILMSFILSGDITNEASHSKPLRKNSNGLHNLQYITSFNRSYQFHKNSAIDSFCIFLSKNFFFRLIGKDNILYKRIQDHIEKGEDMDLSEGFLPMRFEMESIINKVRTCSRTGSLYRLCLEIKVQELLLLQLEQYHNLMAEEKAGKISLHEDDITQIKIAKTVLEENYNAPPTIKELARMVGLNQSKLKKGFKEVFQSTIHDYVTNYKMEKASELVRGQNIQVREVAMELGYKNPSHFSAAFKKHFGFLPTEMVG